MSNLGLWSPPSEAPSRVKTSSVILRTIYDLKAVSGIFYARGWRWMDGKRDNPNSDWWLVEAANLPTSYSSESVVDAKSPISIVIFCIFVLLVCLQVSVLNASYSIRTMLLSLFLQWNGFLASWCLFLEEMRITMEEWLVLVLRKWQEQNAMWR